VCHPLCPAGEGEPLYNGQLLHNIPWIQGILYDWMEWNGLYTYVFFYTHNLTFGHFNYAAIDPLHVFKCGQIIGSKSGEWMYCVTTGSNNNVTGQFPTNWPEPFLHLIGHRSLAKLLDSQFMLAAVQLPRSLTVTNHPRLFTTPPLMQPFCWFLKGGPYRQLDFHVLDQGVAARCHFGVHSYSLPRANLKI
jgi:hypothetical protein